jgi:hypothetical protein
MLQNTEQQIRTIDNVLQDCAREEFYAEQSV